MSPRVPPAALCSTKSTTALWKNAWSAGRAVMLRCISVSSSSVPTSISGDSNAKLAAASPPCCCCSPCTSRARTARHSSSGASLHASDIDALLERRLSETWHGRSAGTKPLTRDVRRSIDACLASQLQPGGAAPRFHANFNLCALCWQNVKPNDWRLLSVTCSRCAH
eukprot:scaffold69970_cov69-Phaeocystis_antarctica.AAC.4